MKFNLPQMKIRWTQMGNAIRIEFICVHLIYICG
jgi:hypothetical protein